MGNAKYFTPNAIPLFFIRLINGAPVTGLVVSVSVINSVTGALLLSPITLTETGFGSGQYTYLWAFNPASTVECLATYTVAGKEFKEAFTVDTALDQILSDDSQST